MPRSSLSIALAFALASLPATAARAQQPAPGVPAGCTYATCALRVEAGWNAENLVRGAGGDIVGKIGPFGGNVEMLLSGSDSTVAHARQYLAERGRARTLTVVSLAFSFGTSLAYAASQRSWSSADNSGLYLLGFGIGTGTALAATHYGLKASRALARSVWWYNADLPR